MVAQLGLTNQDVASVLGAAMGGGYVNYFTIAGRSYQVIPQVLQKYRLNPAQVLNLHLRDANGSLVQLGTIAHLQRQTVPESINHFQQLNSATIAGAPAVSQGDGTGLPAEGAAGSSPERLHRRLLGRLAPVRTGLQRVSLHVRLRPHHRLSLARGAVRELS